VCIEVVVIESPRHELTVDTWPPVCEFAANTRRGGDTHDRACECKAARISVGRTFLVGKVQIIPPHEHRLPHTLLATA
jgi:hypothetical protein